MNAGLAGSGSPGLDSFDHELRWKLGSSTMRQSETGRQMSCDDRALFRVFRPFTQQIKVACHIFIRQLKLCA